MAKHYEVLAFLRPNGGYVQTGTEFEDIAFVDCEPFTKKEYTDAFAAVDAKKIAVENELAERKMKAEAKLAALGLTTEDLQVLGLA